MDILLKNFKEHSEYEQFIESDKFILPNVSYCDDENVGKVTIVHYHPYSSQTLTFENLVTATTVDSGVTNVATNDKPDGGRITYDSSNPSIATVNADSGEVNALIGGTVTITATAEGTSKYRPGSASYTLFVEKLEQIVTIDNPTGESVSVGDEYTISASTDGDGTLSYTSSDESIATVDENGVVSGISEGEVVITVKASETDRYKESEEVYTLSVEAGYDKEYFTIVPRESCTIKFSNSGMQYSKDNGANWSTITNPSQGVSGEVGDKIMFRSTLSPSSSSGIGTFSASTGSFDVEGNAMSLLYGASFENNLTMKQNAFIALFHQTKVVNADKLVLPSTTLSTLCYQIMFQECTSLEKAPKLPAETLAYDCYERMFKNCTNLVVAPNLNATTLDRYCYANMFQGCTSLTTAPEILPATTLPEGCYSMMFFNCPSLEKAPKLPAKNVPTVTCYSMFANCSNLKHIECLAETWVEPEGYNMGSFGYWVNGVSETGTFVKAANANWTRGVNGIPTGWTVEEA